MELTPLPLELLITAPWNANQADAATLARIRNSIRRFGLVQNLVVRPMGKEKYEVLSGNQRLRILKEEGFSPVPCQVVDLDDNQAKFLAQGLNQIHGQDDMLLKADVVRDLLKVLSEEEIISLLPDSKLSLQGLANLGQETIATYLQNWNQAQSFKLHNLQFRLTQKQLELVQNTLNVFMNKANQLQGNNPNVRGNALYLLCEKYLERSRK